MIRFGEISASVKTEIAKCGFLTLFAQYAAGSMQRHGVLPSVRPSVCMSRLSTAASSCGGLAVRPLYASEVRQADGCIYRLRAAYCRCKSGEQISVSVRPRGLALGYSVWSRVSCRRGISPDSPAAADSVDTLIGVTPVFAAHSG